MTDTLVPEEIEENVIGSGFNDIINPGIDTGKKRMMSDWGFTKSGSLSFYDVTGYPLVRVNSDGFYSYNGAGTTLFSITNLGLSGYGTAEDIITLKKTPTSNYFGTIGYIERTGDGAFYLVSGTGCLTWIDADKSLYLTAGEGVFIYSGGTQNITIASDKDVVIDALENGRKVKINADSNIELLTGGDFMINGVPKAAIVNTTKGYKALYCSESPQVWFFDFCYGKRTTRKWYLPWLKDWFIKPDPLFLEVTEGNTIIIPTGMRDIVQIWRLRKGMADKRFENKTEEEFERNNKFWNTPHIDNTKKGVNN
jgi:hypothetical protein